jgi:cell division protein FtsZ
MRNGGTALMGSATASGEKRAENAATEALSSPLLDGLSIHGARNVLVNITANQSLGIREATAATKIIQMEAGDDVEVIFGTVIDEEMGDELRITVIATGFDSHGRGVQKKGQGNLALRLDPVEYKGEQALSHLDEPAFERRNRSVSTLPPSHVNGDGAPAGGTARVRRVQKDEMEDRTERIAKGNDDVPAFLRKMLD